jgi:hypothetical protein
VTMPLRWSLGKDFGLFVAIDMAVLTDLFLRALGLSVAVIILIQVHDELIAVDGFGTGEVVDGGGEVDGQRDGGVEGGDCGVAMEGDNGWVVEGDGGGGGDCSGGAVCADGDTGAEVPVRVGYAVRFGQDRGAAEFEFEGCSGAFAVGIGERAEGFDDDDATGGERARADCGG